MKKYFVLLGICLLSLQTFAQKSEIKYLSGTDKDHTVDWDFYCTKGRNSGVWSQIKVPSHWEFQGFGAFNYGQNEKVFYDEKGIYKYQFTVPNRWKHKIIYLVFEGAMTDTEVKLNGKSAGPIHQGAFYQFRYEVSNLLLPGKKNLLEVTVSKESADATVNKAERRGDFWAFGGLYRPVYLQAFPEEFVDRVAIDAKADGTIKLEASLSGISKAQSLEAQILTTKGEKVGSPFSVTLEHNQQKSLLQEKIDGIQPWNPEQPKLYDLSYCLKAGGKTLFQGKQRFGFRTVEVREHDGIYVNNQKIIFRGVCHHTAWPTTGRCSSKELSILDVNLMKDMNMNAVRMSHYPPDQHFLEVCDSLGLFVLDELTGWQAYYGTEVGKKLVKELVERDVNHPSIVLWDNGNEGGFNKELRDEYAKYDPQKRVVIEPWAKLNGTDTKHYPGYKYVENALNTGNLIYFPTEFLHGLYDGGLGAGLDDYWNLMSSKPLGAGGFLWVFADEGIVRSDLKDSIDTHGNNAPDGILGPYREKEGSYFTIREIWSPVHITTQKIDASFDGKLGVTNSFLFTNLGSCQYSGELVKFNGSFPGFTTTKTSLKVEAPHLGVGESGHLNLNLPANWQEYDLIQLSATDPFGRLINQWSWKITSPNQLKERIVRPSNEMVTCRELENEFQLSSGNRTVKFSKKDGRIMEVLVGDQQVAFGNGPVVVGDTLDFQTIQFIHHDKEASIEIRFGNSPDRYFKWTMKPGGWLELDYQLHPTGKTNFTGITFDTPENKVKGATLLGDGPYHVWKNRIKGNQFGLYNKPYNNAVTGESWDYPEFKGYYSNFYALQLQTGELPVTIVSGSEELFLRLFTPQSAKFSKGGTSPAFPSGDISLLHGISAIGTKFTRPEAEGPQSQKNEYFAGDKPLSAKIYFYFGNLKATGLH